MDGSMKLFAIYIGGRMPGATVELHDLRLVLAPSLKDTYAQLRREWWGIPESLHLDCWSELTRADGYAVTLKPEPYNSPQKLYFVNLGGYDAAEFTELHKNIFIVAESDIKAKARALNTVRHWQTPHRDALYSVEDILCLNTLFASHSQAIHLTKIDDTSAAPFTCRYVPIGKKLKQETVP